MWHNARLLNFIGTGFFLVAVLILAQIGWTVVSTSQRFVLQRAMLVGMPRHVTAEQVAEVLNGQVIGNFFSADLGHVKSLVESIPWVRTADVRRQWPDRLEIRIEEHKALGRWGETRMLSVHGEVFTATPLPELPAMVGPDGSEGEVARRFVRFRELVKPLGAEPVRVELSARHAWTLALSNGLVMQLGRDDARAPVDVRLQRYVGLHEATTSQLGRPVQHVDLRYPNGFAVRVAGFGSVPVKPAPGARKKG